MRMSWAVLAILSLLGVWSQQRHGFGVHAREIQALYKDTDAYLVNDKFSGTSEDEFTWQLCPDKEEEEYAFTITSVSLKPDRITRGTTAFFSIGAEFDSQGKTVESGSIDMSVYLHGIQVFSEQDDVCEKAHCPLVGDGSEFQINYARDFPIYTPPGRYRLKLDGHDLFCIDMYFTVHFFRR